MPAELDHIFICASCGGDESISLAAFGLTEGPRNVHPGQGTACRRFVFANSYLELLWVSDAAEAQSELVQLTHLWERWSGRARGACPFGLGFRPQNPLGGDVPFDNWEYRPPYLAAPLHLQVATNAHVLTEPLLFYLPFGQRPDRHLSARQPELTHRAGLRELTRVELASPHADKLSPEMRSMTDSGLVQFRAGPAYHVDLGFDGESHGQHADFRPLLPLVFRW